MVVESTTTTTQKIMDASNTNTNKSPSNHHHHNGHHCRYCLNRKSYNGCDRISRSSRSNGSNGSAVIRAKSLIYLLLVILIQLSSSSSYMTNCDILQQQKQQQYQQPQSSAAVPIIIGRNYHQNKTRIKGDSSQGQKPQNVAEETTIEITTEIHSLSQIDQNGRSHRLSSRIGRSDPTEQLDHNHSRSQYNGNQIAIVADSSRSDNLPLNTATLHLNEADELDTLAISLATKLERWFNAFTQAGLASRRALQTSTNEDGGTQSISNSTSEPSNQVRKDDQMNKKSTKPQVYNYANDNDAYDNTNNNSSNDRITSNTSNLSGYSDNDNGDNNNNNRHDNANKIGGFANRERVTEESSYGHEPNNNFSISIKPITATTNDNQAEPPTGLIMAPENGKHQQFIDPDDLSINPEDRLIVEQLKEELSRLEVNPYEDPHRLKEWTWCISQIIEYHRKHYKNENNHHSNNNRIIDSSSSSPDILPSSSSSINSNDHRYQPPPPHNNRRRHNSMAIITQQNNNNNNDPQQSPQDQAAATARSYAGANTDQSYNQATSLGASTLNGVSSSTHLYNDNANNNYNRDSTLPDNDYGFLMPNQTNTIGESKLSCPITFDGWRCWPTTVAGETAYKECPSFIPGFLAERKAHKICLKDGTWFKHPSTNRTWSNYTTCVDTADLEFRQKINNLYVIGNSISVGALSISLVIFFSFKSLYCTRVTIHKNLFISFIINNLMWIVWYTYVVSSPQLLVANPLGCQLWHVLLHYFLISNYFWMFCEGLYLHTLLVVAFVSEDKILKWFYLLGWAIPVPITIAYAYQRAQDQEFTQYCWMEESPFNLIIMTPIGISLLLNLVFLINIVRVLVTKLRAVNSPDAHQTRKAVRATLILIPLLGLHYMLTPFRPEPKSHWEVIYESMAAICTSFQGLCVAMLFCFCNGEVIQVIRKKWLQTSFDPFEYQSSCNFRSLNAVITSSNNSNSNNHKMENNNGTIKQDSKDSSATTSFSAGSAPS